VRRLSFTTDPGNPRVISALRSIALLRTSQEASGQALPGDMLAPLAWGSPCPSIQDLVTLDVRDTVSVFVTVNGG